MLYRTPLSLKIIQHHPFLPSFPAGGLAAQPGLRAVPAPLQRGRDASAVRPGVGGEPVAAAAGRVLAGADRLLRGQGRLPRPGPRRRRRRRRAGAVAEGRAGEEGLVRARSVGLFFHFFLLFLLGLSSSLVSFVSNLT